MASANSVITCLQLDQPNIIQQIREDYLHTLIAPMDGMWENAVIPHATFWEIHDQEQHIGECIPSPKQLPYADLGMVVAQPYRGRDLGSSMLIQLKQHCYEAGWKPICSCAADNLASKKAIEKAGFISEHNMVKIQF